MLAILHDVTRCRGCLECVRACARENDLPESPRGSRRSKDGLRADRLTALLPAAEGRVVRRHCLHCLEPACESACLVGAIRRTTEGRVVYDSEKCIGCRDCMLACPFEIPRYEWDTTTPVMRKCEMCKDRPEGPACVAACKYEATVFGPRDDLLRIAHARIAEQPDLYLDHVYGEHDAGGTGVLYISDVSLDHLWPTGLGDRSVPDITWPLMSKTPWMAAGVAGVVGATSWVVHRRMKLEAERVATHEEQR